MTGIDDTRRAFLIGAAVSAGVAAGAAFAPDAQAQDHAGMAEEKNGPAAHKSSAPVGHGAFFNDVDAATIVALTERIWPAAPGKPGATEVGVLNYIDLALAGAYADQQDFYRRGLAALDAYCRGIHDKPFVRLTAEQRDEILKALDAGKATGFTWPSAKAFFERVRTHTMEGLFADPIYGGNHGFAGWRQIAFPGAQPIFTPEDLQSTQAFSREPIVGIQS
jgi:gluconate 2-dehydrogenase gamma chain